MEGTFGFNELKCFFFTGDGLVFYAVKAYIMLSVY